MLRKRDAKLKNPIHGDDDEARRLPKDGASCAARRRARRARYSPASTGTDPKDAEAVPRRYSAFERPSRGDAVQRYDHADVGDDKICSARLRADLASRTHLRLALAVPPAPTAMRCRPSNRPVCEKAVDAPGMRGSGSATVRGTRPGPAGPYPAPAPATAPGMTAPTDRFDKNIKRVGC